MITANTAIKEMINSPVRKINAKVELYEGSTLVDTFTHDGKLIEFTVERVCEEGKFFGFGICQHAKVKILDIEREVDYITTAHSMKIYYGVDDEYVCAHPTFYITQSRRDENTNELTIYGYDAIYPASTHTLAETGYDLTALSVTPEKISIAISNFLGLTGYPGREKFLFAEMNHTFRLEFFGNQELNLDGSETLREVLDDIAEMTQSIYFVDNTNNLVFKRLTNNEDYWSVDLVIGKEDYIKLDTKNGKRLSKIVSATELGDNYSASIDATGSTAYVRDNAFWAINSQVATLVDKAIEAVGGLSIRQFDMEWRGNFLVEPGDRIDITTKDGSLVTSFLLDDTITYNGALSQKTKWNYKEEEETESNPTSLGEILKNTTAKVDKANQQINLAVKKVEGYDSRFTELELDIEGINATFEQSIGKVDGFDNRITQLELDADGITASVQQIQKNTEDRMDAMNEELETVMNKVEATMTPEAVEIKIQEAIGDGVNQITTETGFTFNDVGLTVSKTGSEMTTTITEDGMSVYKDGSEVLTADNTGVQAIDLRATTYLHIGTFSRFQDYEGGRTGCFWIV